MGESSGSYRSYDACKNEWKNIIQPILSQTSSHDKRADIKLLTHIAEWEYDEDSEIDFEVVDNHRTKIQNQTRWQTLLKNFGVARGPRKSWKKAELLLQVVKNRKRVRPKPRQNKPPHLRIDILQFYNNNY